MKSKKSPQISQIAQKSTKIDGHRVALAAIFTAIATFFLYWPALGHDFIQFDDPQYVTANERVLAGITWEGLHWAFLKAHAANWHPLTWISHMLDCQIYGLNPMGHHLTSILFHAANAALALLVLNRMTGAFWRSLVVAVFFAWHPLRVESVAWVSERKDVLSGFFFFLTLLAYTRYVQRRNTVGQPTWAATLKDPFYLLTLIFFGFGLMSKPMLVTLPFLLLLLDFWPLERFSFKDKSWKTCSRQLLLEKLPFFVLTTASCMVTYFSQRADGATSMIANLDLWPRIQNTTMSYVRYMGKTLWPVDLSIFYPFPPDWWHPFQVLACTTLLISITVVVLRGTKLHGFLPVGWFWYLGTLVPVIGLVQVGEQSMADRYTYITTFGIMILLIWGIHMLVLLRPSTRVPIVLLISPALVICLVLTRFQIGHWKDGESLFRHAKSVTPPYYNTRLCLGIALMVKSKFQEALNEFEEAVALYPQSALSHHNRGTALESLHRQEEALQAFRFALSLDDNLKLSHLGVARILIRKKQYDQAISIYRQGLEREPEDINIRFQLGYALKSAGHFDLALAEWLKVIELKPKHAGACAQAGILLGEAGRMNEALPYLEKATRLDPNNQDYLFNLNYARQQLLNRK